MKRLENNELRKQLKLYFIMGSNNCNRNALDVVKEALEGGATMFQFREKGKGALIGAEKMELAKSIQQLCRTYRVPFIVNDDIELAVELRADGVHIGQEDEGAREVRSRIGEAAILGVSVHSLEEARKAIGEGADYLGIGPIFPTSTKEDAKEANGTQLIQKLREEGFSVPVVGIGGITSHNAGIVMEAGADGVSVITAISMAESPRESARSLANAVGIGLK